MRKETDVTPDIIYIAFEYIFAQKEYMLGAEKAQILYNSVCGALGLAPATIVIVSQETIAM